jgi:Tfp pilus assembly protein FimT
MKKGFTLFEAALAVALLAVLVYLGSVSFLPLIPKYRLEKAVWDIRSALNSARYKALFEGTSRRVRFSAVSYAVDKFDEGKNAWALAERHYCEGVTLESNNSPVFTPEGSVTGLATIYIKNAWGIYKITLAITGRIKSARVL